MLKAILIAVICLLITPPALADWFGETGEDPMNDQKWAYAAAPLDSFGIPSITFKCWESGALQVSILVGRYNDAANYTSLAKASFRIDKGPPLEILLTPHNFSGMLGLTTSNMVTDELVPMLQDILEGKRRLAVSFGNAVYQTNLRGTTRTIGTMFKVCKMPDVYDPTHSSANDDVPVMSSGSKRP